MNIHSTSLLTLLSGVFLLITPQSLRASHTPDIFIRVTSGGGIVFPDKSEVKQVEIVRNGVVTNYRPGLTTVDDLILGRVSGINIPGSNRPVVVDDFFPFSGAPDGYLNNPATTRGLFTPGMGDGSLIDGDEFTEYTFDQPVLNQIGGDLFIGFVTFGPDERTVRPDPYWLSADGRTPTLVDQLPDSRTDSRAMEGTERLAVYSLPNGIETPEDLLQNYTQFQQVGDLAANGAMLNVTLQLIDVSDLGVAPGDSVSSLKIWADDSNGGGAVHPVYIAGLPAVFVPEPGSSTVLIGIGFSVLIRRRATTCRN